MNRLLDIILGINVGIRAHGSAPLSKMLHMNEAE